MKLHLLVCILFLLFLSFFRPSCLEQSPPAKGSPEIRYRHHHQDRHLWYEDLQNPQRHLLQEEEAEEAPSPGGRDLRYGKGGKLVSNYFRSTVVFLATSLTCCVICRSTSWRSRGRRTRRRLMLSCCPSSRRSLSWKDTCAPPSPWLMAFSHTSWFSKYVIKTYHRLLTDSLFYLHFHLYHGVLTASAHFLDRNVFVDWRFHEFNPETFN